MTNTIKTLIFQTLIKNPNPTFDNGTTLLHLAAKKGHVDLVKTLMDFDETYDFI